MKKERNTWIFRDKESPSWVVGHKFIRAIKEIFLPQNGGKGDFNILDPLMNTIVKNKSKRDGVVWLVPPTDWLKANFNGSAKCNLGRVGFG